jgi:hypothetical protein
MRWVTSLFRFNKDIDVSVLFNLLVLVGHHDPPVELLLNAAEHAHDLIELFVVLPAEPQVLSYEGAYGIVELALIRYESD